MTKKKLLGLSSTLRQVPDPIIEVECRACGRAGSYVRAELEARRQCHVQQAPADVSTRMRPIGGCRRGSVRNPVSVSATDRARQRRIELVFLKSSYEIHGNHIRADALRTDAESILVELVPSLSLMAAIADDGSGGGKPHRWQDLDETAFSRTIGRFWHGNLPEFLLE